MINNIAVGKKIAELRIGKNITQQTLAVVMSVSHQAVSKWETGMALPDTVTLQKLARFFGVTMDEILSAGEDEAPAAGYSDNNGEDTDYSELSIDGLIKMAPFMSRDTIDELALKYTGKMTAAQISRLAPFMSEGALEQLIINSDSEISWDTLQRIAPFLGREMVDSIAKMMASGKKFFKPFVSNIKKTVDDIGNSIDVDGIGKNITQKFNDLGNTISRAFDNAMKDAGGKHESVNVRKNMRDSIFMKALQDENFTWIGEHIDSLANDELKEKIIAKARELGMGVWVSEFFGAEDEEEADALNDALKNNNFEVLEGLLDGADEETVSKIVDAAVNAKRYGWIKDNFDALDMDESTVNRLFAACFEDRQWDLMGTLAEDYEIGRENIANVVGYAVENLDFEWLKTHADELELDEFAGELARAAYGAGNGEFALDLVDSYCDAGNMNDLAVAAAARDDTDFLDGIFESIDTSDIGPICVALADNGYLEYAVNYIDGSDDENAISLLLDKALEANNWDLIDKLNELI